MKANAWNISLETIYRGQLTLSTQMMILNLSLKCQLRNCLPWPIYIINSADNTELQRFQPSRFDRESPDLIGSLPIWCLASRSPDFYQILPIYHKILKTRGKLLIFRIFGDLSLWNTHIILTFFAKSIMVCYNSGRNDVKIQEMALERT